MTQKKIDFQRPQAILVSAGEDHYFDLDSVYRCPVCGWEADLNNWDVVGAEPDCVFCNHCNEECRL